MSLKIAMIGAGSLVFTRRLLLDLVVVPELSETHFAFMDINYAVHVPPRHKGYAP